MEECVAATLVEFPCQFAAILNRFAVLPSAGHEQQRYHEYCKWIDVHHAFTFYNQQNLVLFNLIIHDVTTSIVSSLDLMQLICRPSRVAYVCLCAL